VGCTLPTNFAELDVPSNTRLRSMRPGSIKKRKPDDHG
jgi:hypothetical protein